MWFEATGSLELGIMDGWKVTNLGVEEVEAALHPAFSESAQRRNSTSVVDLVLMVVAGRVELEDFVSGLPATSYLRS